MRRSRARMFILSVFALSVTTILLDAQRRPPIHWVDGGATVVVGPGEIFDFEARFFSDMPISNAHWWVSQGLDPLFVQTGSITPLGNLEANKIYTIKHRIIVPTNLQTHQYKGVLEIYHHKENGNQSVTVYPEVLNVTIYVMDAD